MNITKYSEPITVLNSNAAEMLNQINEMRRPVN